MQGTKDLFAGILKNAETSKLDLLIACQKIAIEFIILFYNFIDLVLRPTYVQPVKTWEKWRVFCAPGPAKSVAHDTYGPPPHQ